MHSRFKTFLGFFSPASDADRRLLAAFICAPLWHVPGIPHPSWIIDSQDGAESGKTKVVELVAKLYASEPIRTSQAERQIQGKKSLFLLKLQLIVDQPDSS